MIQTTPSGTEFAALPPVEGIAPVLKDLSVMRRVDALARVPVFLLHGDADGVVPVHHSRDLAAALRAANGSVVYHEVPGGEHDDAVATAWQDAIPQFIVDASRS